MKTEDTLPSGWRKKLLDTLKELCIIGNNDKSVRVTTDITEGGVKFVEVDPKKRIYK